MLVRRRTHNDDSANKMATNYHDTKITNNNSEHGNALNMNMYVKRKKCMHVNMMNNGISTNEHVNTEHNHTTKNTKTTPNNNDTNEK